jgi:hypothetical protein
MFRSCTLFVALLAMGCYSGEVRRQEARRSGCPAPNIQVTPACEDDFYRVYNGCRKKTVWYGCELDLWGRSIDCLRAVPRCAYGPTPHPP